MSELSLFRRYYTLGIDVNPTSITIVILSRFRSIWRIEGYAHSLLVKEANEHTIIHVLQSMCKKFSFRYKSIISALPEALVCYKKIQIHQALNACDIEEWVQLQAAQYISFPVQQMYFDFQILGPSEEEGFSDLLFIASHEEHIHARMRLFQKAGLNISVIDVDTFARARMAYFLTQNHSDRIYLFIDMRCFNFYVLLMRNKELLWSSIESFDLNLKCEEGLIFCKQVLAKIRDVLTRISEFEVTEIVFTGSIIASSELISLLESEFDIPVHIKNVTEHFKLSKNISTNQIKQDGAFLFLALGLATWLREE